MECKKDLDLTKSIQIISFQEDGSLKVQSNALRFFKKNLKTPCSFISIIGPVRQGKSLLLNLIIGNLNPQTSSGRFSMSDGLESHTRGVFIYPTPIENGGVSYYFLDCQGKENKKEEDIRVFTLMCLISSLCIFQAMKTLTYDHDFLLPYLKSRKYIKEVLAQDTNYSEQTLIINPDLKLLFLVRDCPDSKKAEVNELFQKVFLDYEDYKDYKEENNIQGNRSLKQIEVDKRNNVRELLKEEFNLTEDDVFNLPYYLEKIEDNYKWKKYNEDIKEDILSESFKKKVDILVKNHIIGHVRPLGYETKRGIFSALRGPELAQIIVLYVKMINDNKVNNIFDEIELLLLKVKDEVMSLYIPNLPKLFDNSEEISTRFTNIEEFESYYNKKFDRLLESFKAEIKNSERKNQIKIASIKSVVWIEEFERNFQLLLEKEITIFKKELEIQRIKREEEERKRLEEEERKRLEDEQNERQRLDQLKIMEAEKQRLEENQKRRIEQETRQQQEMLQKLQRQQELETELRRRTQLGESKMSIENTLNLDFGKQKSSPGLATIIDMSQISSVTAKRFDMSVLTQTKFVGDVSYMSNVSPNDAKKKLADFDKSQLRYTKKGTLDMRYNVNKNYHNLMILSQMDDDINQTILKSSINGVVNDDILLPRKMDGTLDLRYNINKVFIAKSLNASQQNSQKFDNYTLK